MSSSSPQDGRQRLVPPRSYANKIADILREEIQRGIFRPGERLPTESQLGTNFGVSRAVVREAISALKHDGTLESFQGRGIFVAKQQPEATFRLRDTDLHDQDDLQQILEFLITNEVGATALAAERRTDEELARIHKALLDMETAIARNESGINEDIKFHAEIVAATRNPFFITFSSFLENRVRYLIRNARENSKRAGLTSVVQQEHRAIFEAIKARNKSKAREAAERHLRNAAARLREHWSTEP